MARSLVAGESVQERNLPKRETNDKTTKLMCDNPNHKPNPNPNPNPNLKVHKKGWSTTQRNGTQSRAEASHTMRTIQTQIKILVL